MNTWLGQVHYCHLWTPLRPQNYKIYLYGFVWISPVIFLWFLPEFSWISHRISFGFLPDSVLVDHPTQLICIWIFICWVGGGDLCGAAELCINGPCNQKKQARTNVFSKYLCHVHKDCLEAKTGTTNWVKPPKKELFVSCIPEFLKWGIPQNGNFQNEGSLKMEISKTRDPSK